MTKFISLLFLAVLLFLPGCSGEKKPKVVLKETDTEKTFVGHVVCPACRSVLSPADVKVLNQQMLLCRKCQKSAPKIKFYPDAKKTR